STPSSAAMAAAVWLIAQPTQGVGASLATRDGLPGTGCTAGGASWSACPGRARWLSRCRKSAGLETDQRAAMVRNEMCGRSASSTAERPGWIQRVHARGMRSLLTAWGARRQRAVRIVQVVGGTCDERRACEMPPGETRRRRTVSAHREYTVPHRRLHPA